MKSIRYLFVLLSVCTALRAAEPSGPILTNAILKKVEALDTKILGGSDVYVIELTFVRPFPKAWVKHNLFRIQEKDDGSIVTVKSLRQRNLDETIGGVTNSAGLVTGGVPGITGLEINGDFNPARNYLLTVSLSNQVPFTVPVTLEGEKPDPKAPKPTINIGFRFFSMDLTPFATDDDGALGLKYDVRYMLRRGYVGGGVVSVELQTHGEFSITPEKDSTNSIQNSLKGGLTASYLYNVPVTLPLSGETRTYVYPLGFRVSPAEFEANKSFSHVDYTAKILLGGAIPYADYPALLWNKAMNLKVPFFAPTLFTGFAALSEVRDDGSDRLSKLGHTRWDTEFIYALPLHNRVDFKFVWNWYVGIENGFSKDNYEIGAVLYLNDARTQGLTFSRQKGALPPNFIQTESWRIGYTAQF